MKARRIGSIRPGRAPREQVVGDGQVVEAPEDRYERLYHKYSHIGCPAAHMEDNCAHPDRCAENGRCLDLGPNPFEKGRT